MGNLIFKGIQQVLASGFTQDAAENGVLYFVRNAETNDADIYFGKKHYGSLNATQIATLQESIHQKAKDIAAIETLLGDFKEQFKGDIQTVAQVTKANAEAISVLNGDAETAGSVAKAVADAKSELLGDAAEGYNTLGKLEDKILAVEDAAKTYTISAVTVSGEENVLEAYALYDEDGTQAGETIKIYKDQSLKNVELSGQTLVFTYELAAGSEKTVSVDVSAFLSESEFNNGLQVVDHKVSVKIDTSSEEFLSVSANGIKLSGVQDAIDDAVAKKNVEAEGDRYISATVTGNKVTVGATTDLTNAIDKANRAVQTIATGTDNGTIKVDGTDVAVKGLGSAAYTDSSDYATAEQGEKADNAATKTDFNAHSGNTDMHITADERSAWNAKLDTTTYENYTASTKSVLDTIKEDLSNTVTSVASTGSTILVSETEGAVNVEVNTLTHAESGQDGYVILNKTDNGALYGVMYYGGDDAE